MDKNTVFEVKSFFDKINDLLGISLDIKVRTSEKKKTPVSIWNDEVVVCPEIFNHPELSDNVRKVLLTKSYSYMLLFEKMHGYPDISPAFMAKGICSLLGIDFLSGDELEKSLRAVRRKIFDEAEYACRFDIGCEYGKNETGRYLVVDVVRDGDEILVTAKKLGDIDTPEETMKEEELFERCFKLGDLKKHKVDMRKNLVVLSGPSGVGKDTVVKELLKKYPQINKTVSVTTRPKRSYEKEGIDYHYVSKEEFYKYQTDDSLVEYELYDGEFYGTLFSEVERYPEDVPLILVIDVRGRRNVMMRYPMARSVFIAPPSFEALKERIIARNENTPDEIEHRLSVAKDELDKSKKYDYTVVNDNLEECVTEIGDILFGNV